MASRMVWLPLSAPSQTSLQPARPSARTAAADIRSQRLWMVKGMVARRARTVSLNSSSHDSRKAKMSSANHNWSGAMVALSSAISSTTSAGLRMA